MMRFSVLFSIAIAALLVSLGFLAINSWVYDESSAKECAITMLDEFGMQIAPDFEMLTGAKYSEFVSYPLSAEDSDESYLFQAKVVFEDSQIEHLVDVPASELCPSFWGKINVIISARSSEVFDKFVESLRR